MRAGIDDFSKKDILVHITVLYATQKKKAREEMPKQSSFLSWKKKYKNETPIEDPMEALWLLVRSWQENSTRELLRDKALYADEKPHVRVAWYANRTDEFMEADNYLVADDVASKLLTLGYVHGTPGMGYTDSNRLIITRQGEDAAYTYHRARIIREMILAAEKAGEWWYICDKLTKTKPTHAFLIAPQSPNTPLHRGGGILVRAHEVFRGLGIDWCDVEEIFGTEKQVENSGSPSDPFELLKNCPPYSVDHWTALVKLIGKKLVVFYDESSYDSVHLKKIGEYLPDA